MGGAEKGVTVRGQVIVHATIGSRDVSHQWAEEVNFEFVLQNIGGSGFTLETSVDNTQVDERVPAPPYGWEEKRMIISVNL